MTLLHRMEDKPNMKTIITIFPCLLCLPWSVSAADKPNIVVVFIDDMGWGDFSCFGNTEVKTENIDRLATEGLRFEQFYVNSPICSPSRTAISTGQYPQRWRITSYLSNRAINNERGMAQWLDPNAPMLARRLSQAGYAAGHFGKWHMGGQRDVSDAPSIIEYGFDASLTNFEGMGPKLLPLTLKPGQGKPGRIWADAERLGDGARWMLRSEITGGFVDEAIRFIKQAGTEHKPFYVNLWPDDVHSPFWPPVDEWADGKHGLYLAVLQEMDRQLGVLFDYIRDSDRLRDNTLVLVCSDNGPEPGAGSAGPFRGAKTMLYEGGIRSPLVVWGPGLTEAARAGTVNETSCFAAIDLVPTLLALAGEKTTPPRSETRKSVNPAAPPPPPNPIEFDGEVLLDVLLGKSDASRTQPLFFRRPPDRDDFYGINNLPDLAVRDGDWKLLCEYDGSQPQLYDLHNDRGETTNLAAGHSDVVKRLTALVVAWHQSLPPDNGPAFRKKVKRKK